mmetsp:Transcript_23021/g.48120  ORF Transcript_23021/g.48120 Transcript_23021/m.48120 type:complete len:161 (+) Transcript_23021:145-627(+)
MVAADHRLGDTAWACRHIPTEGADTPSPMAAAETQIRTITDIAIGITIITWDEEGMAQEEDGMARIIARTLDARKDVPTAAMVGAVGDINTRTARTAAAGAVDNRRTMVVPTEMEVVVARMLLLLAKAGATRTRPRTVIRGRRVERRRRMTVVQSKCTTL